MYLLTPKISSAAATPANSAMVLPMLVTISTKDEQDSDLHAEVLAYQVGQAFAGDDAHPRAHFLDDDQGHGNRDHRPQQAETEMAPASE